MVKNLEACDTRQSDFDPCLFIGDKVILIMYVDDMLMWSTSEEHIYKLGAQLRNKGVELEEEDDAAGFLGVKLHKHPTTGQLVMTQQGLIDRIIEALGLHLDKSTPKKIPYLKSPLTKDLDGDPPRGHSSTRAW